MMTSLTEGKSSASDPKRDNRRAMTVRILLVDDFEPCRTLVSLILQDQPGYQIVGEASSGPQAIERIAELSPELVVLDIGLPGLNGIEVARQIRNCSPGSTILFLTGDHDPEVARRALYVGARGYVHKFDIVSELATAAKEVLSGKRFVSRRFRNLGVNARS